MFKREFKKYYGEDVFQEVINFDGYGAKNQLLYNSTNAITSIWVHSNMIREIQTRGNQNCNSLKEAYSNYDNVYVGQSMTVFARVRNHLTGHGNGDVYAEVKYNAPCGEQIFVVFVPCDAKDLNDKEKELIRQFNAQQSFNKTAGGARERF